MQRSLEKFIKIPSTSSCFRKDEPKKRFQCPSGRNRSPEAKGLGSEFLVMCLKNIWEHFKDQCDLWTYMESKQPSVRRLPTIPASQLRFFATEGCSRNTNDIVLKYILIINPAVGFAGGLCSDGPFLFLSGLTMDVPKAPTNCGTMKCPALRAKLSWELRGTWFQCLSHKVRKWWNWLRAHSEDCGRARAFFRLIWLTLCISFRAQSWILLGCVRIETSPDGAWTFAPESMRSIPKDS